MANRDNRNSLPILKTDHTELSNSGKKISIEEFIGPFYDLKNKKHFPLCFLCENKKSF